jgi:K+-sensing histidine kinase KdpD
MSAPHMRPDNRDWDRLSPDQVLEVLVHDLYHPISAISSQIKRLTTDEDPLSEDDYEEIFEQMDLAVRQLSKTVVQLKRYTADRQQS